MRRMHPHPIMILENLSRFIFLLIIPLARGFVFAFTGGSIYEWLQGAWLDVLIVLGMLTASILRYWAFTYTVNRKGILIERGVIARDSFFVPAKLYTTLSEEAGWWMRPFGAVHIRMDTMAGSPHLPDLTLTVSKKESARLFRYYTLKNDSYPYLDRTYKPSTGYIAFLSASTSNSFVGVLFLSTLISNTGSLIGQNLEEQVLSTVESISSILAIIIPPAAAFLSLVMICGFAISFLLNFCRHIGFTVRREKYTLYISGGIFTKRRNIFELSHINFIDIRQTPLMKLFSLSAVYAHCIGLGKNKNDISAIIPCASKKELAQGMDLLLKEFPIKPVQLRPNNGAIFKFILEPLWYIGLIIGGAWLSCRYFAAWSEMIIFIAWMLEIPAVLFLIVRFIDFRTTGLSYDGENLYLKYSRFFALHTVCLPKKNVNVVLVRQSMIQHFDDACDIKIYSIGENRQTHHIKNLHRPDVFKLLDFVKI